MTPIKIFVGYDEREAIAYHVCCNSIIRHAKRPVSFTPLALNLFNGFYDELHTDGSNAFIYTRFLVPYLCGFQGRAIFIDGDMVVRDDITKLMEFAPPGTDMAVVKHDYKTKYPNKYLGNKNEDYPKKNWSSVMLFNCYTSPCHKLIPEFVARQTGAYLHQFQWTSEDRIDALPLEWNWLAMEYEKNDNAKLYHYTIGTPCFEEYAKSDNAEIWWDEFHKTVDLEE
jgi:lipopolysaccharide biosynthesis glycosyltransferase